MRKLWTVVGNWSRRGAGLDALWRHKPVLYRASETGRRLSVQVVAGKVTAAKVSWRF